MQLEWIGRSRQDPDNSQSDPARLINFYRESTGEKYVVKRVPAMRAFSYLNGVPLRAMTYFPNRSVIYAAMGGGLYGIGQYGNHALYATIADDANTTISGNNAAVTVAANGEYFVFEAEVLTQPTTGAITDIGSVSFFGQRTILTERDGRRVQWSGVADAQTFDALDFATTEGRDDDNIRGMPVGGQFWIFKEGSIEQWYLTGGDDFMAPLSGSTIEVGLKSFNLLTSLTNGAFFIGNDGIAYLTGGDEIRPISSRSVETALRVNDPTDCVYYEDEGHKFCAVRFSDRPAWVYDMVSDEWHERAEGVTQGPWLATTSVLAFNRSFVGTTDGHVFEMARDNVDGTGPLVSSAVSRTLRKDGDYFTLDRVELMGQTGFSDIGTATAAALNAGSGFGLHIGGGYALQIATLKADPRAARVMLRTSKDRGVTWGREKWRSVGSAGEYDRVVRASGLGAYRSATVEIRVTDEAELTFDATAEVQAS